MSTTLGSNAPTDTLAPALDPFSASKGSLSYKIWSGEVGIGNFVPTSLQCAAPAGVGDALLDDAQDDDVESDMIADDSGVDIGASEPAGAGGGSSSGTQQYPPHFSSLDFDAMRQEGVPGEPAGFGARDAEGSAGGLGWTGKVHEEDPEGTDSPPTGALDGPTTECDPAA
ncbi:hypothetical protein Ahy_B03g068542 [Arachis hypogaea]|uniref:Uncharacterized protein n=1 Tax=Arachis hypogaea TaxID=3818 RepID=A0A445AA62_ARAHY|nr:hypothetical protein Ahy_B03g068542 [Arachis hypogaea]